MVRILSIDNEWLLITKSGEILLGAQKVCVSQMYTHHIYITHTFVIVLCCVRSKTKTSLENTQTEQYMHTNNIAKMKFNSFRKELNLLLRWVAFVSWLLT